VTEVGGCGTVAVTAEVQSFPLTSGDVANVRSPDFTGDGVVNYFDTFHYLPMLNAATGYCGNLDNDPSGVVNFFDTSIFLSALVVAATCP